MLREKIKQPMCHNLINGKFVTQLLFVVFLNLSSREPLWIMARKKVNIFSTEKEYYQFQVGCVSYFNLKQNNSFKDQVDNFFPLGLILKLQHK